VESFRNAEGQPRQRIVVSLGCASLPEDELKFIAKVLERKLRHQRDFFSQQQDAAQLSEQAAYWVDRIYRKIARAGRFCQPQSVGDTEGMTPSSPPLAAPGSPPGSPGLIETVRLNEIEHENSSMLGPLLPVKAAWESLRISQCLQDLGFSRKQIAAAAATVMSRLIDPSSEYALVRWIPTTALPELLGDAVLGFDHKGFYRISDKLLKNHEAIESHLRDHSQKLFGLERTVILYDLTNTYFEGEALGNEKAKRGKSKEKRHDRPLVVLGMIYDGSGFALAHKTFAGNTNDGKSLVEMVKDLKRCSGLAPEHEDARHNDGQMELAEQSACAKIKTLVVVDAGVATRDNLALLREAGFSYLVNDTRSKRGRYLEQFRDHAKFEPLPGRGNVKNKPPVEVRIYREEAPGDGGSDANDDGNEGADGDALAQKKDTVLLCRSQGRKQKEKAIFSTAETRFLKQAQKLDHQLKSRRLTDSKKIHQAMGRLKAQNSRVQRFYTIELRSEDDPREGLLFESREHDLRDHCELFGCYALRTDSQNFAAAELWRVYISLTQAEEGFRALKTDLGLRPNFHQKEDRVDGHIFITVMAFHIWKWIRHKLDCANDTRDWVTVRRLLRTHCYATLIVPCEDGGVYHVRTPGRPETQQRKLYELFGVNTSNLIKTTVKYRKIGSK
jgi:transposase